MKTKTKKKPVAQKMPPIRKLATEFTKVLRSWLTEEQWKELLEKNLTLIGTGVCASHDYCDANMAMDQAWRKLMGRGSRASSQDDADLWGAAWDLAKSEHFFEPGMRKPRERISIVFEAEGLVPEEAKGEVMLALQAQLEGLSDDFGVHYRNAQIDWA